MMLVRLEPAAPQSQLKHSTTEPPQLLLSALSSAYVLRQPIITNNMDIDQTAPKQSDQVCSVCFHDRIYTVKPV